MKVDISKGFELGSFRYEVKSDAESEKLLEADAAFGKCDNVNRIVRITKNYTPDQFNNTFIHECIEAVNVVYCNKKMKHEEINNLGNGLAQIMKSLGIQFVRNPSKKDKDGN